MGYFRVPVVLSLKEKFNKTFKENRPEYRESSRSYLHVPYPCSAPFLDSLSIPFPFESRLPW